MRRSVLAALVSLLLAAWPAQAQLFPTATPDVVPGVPAVSEQTLIDTTLYVEPPSQQGLCVVLGAGQVTVTVRRVTDAVAEPRPAKFSLYGFMADPDTHLEIPVSNQEVSTTTHIKGIDRYCWSVTINAPETATMDHAHRGGYVQTVAVRIAFRAD